MILRVLRTDGVSRTFSRDSEWGPVVKVQTVMSTQSGDVILKGTAEVQLPAC